MSASEYYAHSTYPSQGAAGSSAAMRAELELVEAGFAKLPDLSGNGSKLLSVNAGATALEAISAATARSRIGLAIGSDIQAWDADLDALAALSTTGLVARTGAATYSPRTLTAPAAGITVANGDGVAGNPTLALADDLAALEALSGTNTIYYRSAANTWTAVTVGALLSFSAGTLNITDAELSAIAGLTSAADRLPYFTGSGTAALATFTSFGRSLVDDADASAARTTLELVPGTHVQAYDAELAAIAGLASAADKAPYFTGSGTAALMDVSSFARTVLDDANASAARSTLGALASTDTSIGPHTIWIPASAMVPRITGGPAAGLVETATNQIMLKTLDFDDSSYELAQASIRMPKSWDRGTFTAYFLWSNASGTGDVIWAFRAVAIGNDDVLDAAWGAAQGVVDSVTAAGDLMQSGVAGPMTAGGTPAEADWVVFEFYRSGPEGGDTLTGDARLHGVVIIYTTNAATDA